MKTNRTLVILAVLACGWTVLATPASAVDANWRIYLSAIDSDDLAEAFGPGVRVSFPFKDNYEFDISVAYYQDFKDRFEDNSRDRIRIQMDTIPVDFGVTWTKHGDSGFQFGGGLTYGYLDISDLRIDGINEPIQGSANDEFGAYVKLGYQGKKGFFGEVWYRYLEASVKQVAIGGVQEPSTDIALSGYTINLGYRF